MSFFSISEEQAIMLESTFVHRVYASQATAYDDLCDGPWPCIKKFLMNLPSGSFVADVGCGNGKYLNVRDDIIVSGSDICAQFTNIAHKRHQNVIRASNLRLPYRSHSMDAVISVGVLHHIASSRRRVRCVEELSRILKPGGQMLIYVWAREQKWRRFEAQDVLVPWTGCPNEKSVGMNEIESNQGKSKVSPGKDISFSKTISLTKRTGDNSTKLVHHVDSADKGLKAKGQNRNVASKLPLFAISVNKQVTDLMKVTFHLFRDALRNVEHIGGNLLQKYYNEISRMNGSDLEEWGPSMENQWKRSACDGKESQDKTFCKDTPGTTFDNSHRFYHLFVEQELQSLVKVVDDLSIVFQNYDHGNWLIIARKTPTS